MVQGVLSLSNCHLVVDLHTVGIHLCDLHIIPHKLRRRGDLRWWVYYPDELLTEHTRELVYAALESVDPHHIRCTGNQSWPSVWATHTVNQMRYIIQTNHRPRRHYTLLARKPRPHRASIVDQLLTQGSLNNNYHSWLNCDQIEFDNSHLSLDRCVLDSVCSDESDMWSPPAAAFADSAISVVLESNEDQLFITEKTFIPLYQGRMPLIYGAPGLYNTLVGWGFEFPREINLENLCMEPVAQQDHTQRRNSFVNELQRITNKYSPADLVEMYAPYALHNQQTLRALAEQIPHSYYQWRSTAKVKWAHSSKLFIEQIQGAPWIKI